MSARRAGYLTTAELYRLELACIPLARMARANDGPSGVYLVGTAMTSPTFRDVDVRMILHDEAFDALFAEPALWATFSYAVSRWLAADTGLPIDFQVQRMTEANAKHSGPRNPLGRGGRDFAGLGDATPYLVATGVPATTEDGQR